MPTSVANRKLGKAAKKEKKEKNEQKNATARGKNWATSKI
jgi:hypothetical protein